MKFSKSAKACFTTSVVVSLFLAVSSIAPAFAAPPLADDTLLVLLARHSDRAAARASLFSEAQSNTIEDLHVDGEDYSILHVQPPKGQGELTRKNILKMMKNHPEIKSVSPNTLMHHLGKKAPPNLTDPDLSQQWPLAAMRWT